MVGSLAVVVPAGPAAAVPVVLYDQLGPPEQSISSETFVAGLEAFDTEAADDFTVPALTTWQITEVEVRALVAGADRQGTNFRVRIYDTVGELPGTTTLFDQTVVAGGAGATYLLPLAGAPVLGPGTYWVSVQSRAGSTGGSQWFWTRHSPAEQTGFSAAWRNPGGGFGVGCTNFTGIATCSGTAKALSFALDGELAVINAEVECAKYTNPGPGDIVGTPGNDVLMGTPGNDVIWGMGGHDRIFGQGGNDVIIGGPGDDRLDGGEGFNLLCGGDGRDVLIGGSGVDVMAGGPGDDVLAGGGGTDGLWGGMGNDRMDGQSGTNFADGGPGTDTCVNPSPPTAVNCSP